MRLILLMIFASLAFNVLGKEADGCRSEFKKACGGVEKGEGRLQECMAKNMATFSPKCQEKMAKRVGEHEKNKACLEEMKKLCGGVEKGEGRKKKCYEENKSKISADCQKMGNRMKKQSGRKGQDKADEKTPVTEEKNKV